MNTREIPLFFYEDSARLFGQDVNESGDLAPLLKPGLIGMMRRTQAEEWANLVLFRFLVWRRNYLFLDDTDAPSVIDMMYRFIG